MDPLRYPIGRFAHGGPVTDADLAGWTGAVERLPSQLRAAVAGLDGEQLDTPYRPGGWTVRQVVHHVPDSHLNAFVRFKWALTEDAPAIKAYDENGWAALPDTRAVPVETALAFLEALHLRWAGLIRALGREALARTFVHPVSGVNRLDETLGMYAWHGRHHVAHVARLHEREGW